MKKISQEKGVLTHKDIAILTKLITSRLDHLVKRVMRRVHQHFNKILHEIKTVHKSTHFLEREIIENRLKVRQLEKRLNELTREEVKKIH